MKKQILIAVVLGVPCLFAMPQEVAQRENPTLDRILAVMRGRLRPGGAALKDSETQPNFLTDLCQNWKAGRTPEERRELLQYAINLAWSMSPKKGPYRISDERIARAMIEALDDEDEKIRAKAADALQSMFDEPTVRNFGTQIVDSARKWKQPSDAAILLLGRTGLKTAAELLEQNNEFKAASESNTKLALAKLGNKEYEAEAIRRYLSEKDFLKKKLRAYDLAIVATENTAKTLAEDLRTPDIVNAGFGGSFSRRLNVISALKVACPDFAVFESAIASNPKDDSYYEKIERWAEEKYKITWDKPRPPFFYEILGGVR